MTTTIAPEPKNQLIPARSQGHSQRIHVFGLSSSHTVLGMIVILMHRREMPKKAGAWTGENGKVTGDAKAVSIDGRFVFRLGPDI